jgi:TnpA family transposase
MARMKVFNTLEQEAFEAAPRFNGAERKRFFALSVTLNDSLASLRTPTNKVCFLVAAGYFKARRRFFARQFRPADIEFVARQIGVSAGEVQLDSYSKETCARHQRLILSHFGCSPFDEAARGFAVAELATMVRVQFRPKLVLLDIIQVLTRRKIALPSYAVLATLVIAAITHHQCALSRIIDDSLTVSQRARLDALLEKEPEAGAADGGRYRLTLLKKPYQSTQPSKIKANLADLGTLRTLYLELKPVVDRLALSFEGIRYYAYSVIRFQIPQVSRRSAKDRHLHLISFIVYQTFKLQDILIDTLLSSVQAALNATEKEHKESYYQERERRDRSVSEFIDGLRHGILGTLSAIKTIVVDERLTDEQKVAAIDAALNTQEPRKDIVEQRLDDFERNVAALHQGRDYYAVLEDQSLKLQNRVAEIVRQARFDAQCRKPALWEAIRHYQQKVGAVDKNAPVAFLSAEQRAAVVGQNGKFRVSLYKALLYIEIAAAVKAGALNLVHSEKYRSLDDYLIPKADWAAHRDEYLRRAQLEGFADCSATLDELDQELDARYGQTNARFRAGDNPFLTFRANGTFHVATPKLEAVDSLSPGDFLPDRKYISLLEVLATVDHTTAFLDEFEHWQLKYQRPRPPKKIFFAGIIGYGCDIGHRKLAQISKQINENELDSVVNWYFSLANIQSANDRILQVLDRMDLPNLYRQKPDMLHTSSDGQKFEVAVDSLNANYSFKYLGKDKGVSVVSFIDMRQLLWHSTVISSAEREAAYVIDGLMHNDVVKSDIHSTDTHGYSDIIFAATHLLGFSFAPRIKGLGRQRLYAFKNRKHHEQQGHMLMPHRCINPDPIHEQWDEILRFIATIRLKVTTASQLFKRLNSHARQHPLYQALKEFGKIPKTLFILQYVDDPAFRQAIEKQLNKVESSHKFAKAISFGHSHEFIQGEKEDQEIAEGCRRLIKNAIVCWNYLYLSRELNAQHDEERKAELIDAIRNGSVMTWEHINLHGEYDFSDEKMLDSVGLAGPKNRPLPTS